MLRSFLPTQLRGRFLWCAFCISTLFILNYFLWRRELLAWKDYAHVKSWAAMNEADEIIALQRKRPNLPVQFWYAHRRYDMRLNDSCALFPDIMRIHYIHDHWQLLETAKGKVKLLGAFLDDRPVSSTVRLLGMIDKQTPVRMTTWCQLWFHDRRKPVIVPVEEYFYLWREQWGQKPDGVFQPYLMSCRLPSGMSYSTPSSVSLTENYCDAASNSLNVIYNKPSQKRGFAICAKGMNFANDVTVRLVEWIEYLLLLGVEKIYMYDILVTPQTEATFEYYSKKGLLEVETLSLPQIELNEPYLQHMFLEDDANIQSEVIPYNHCVLSHMYEYEYIGIMDTDEVVVPKSGLTTWRELIAKAKARAEKENVQPGSFISRNCYFFDNSTAENVEPTFPQQTYEVISNALKSLDIPDYMHMSRRVFRSKNCSPPGFYIKSIHSTEAVVAVHNHYHLKLLDDNWSDFDFLMEEAFMHHYRNGCQPEIGSICYGEFQRYFEYDDSILHDYDTLKSNVVRALDDLGYF